jgi:hypothetical protein
MMVLVSGAKCLARIIHHPAERRASGAYCCPTNDLVNILAGLVADIHPPKKPSLHLTPEETQQIDSLTEAQWMVA